MKQSAIRWIYKL